MMLGQQIGECLICKLLQTLPLSRVRTERLLRLRVKLDQLAGHHAA